MWREVCWECGVVWNSRELYGMVGIVYGISVLGYRER